MEINATVKKELYLMPYFLAFWNQQDNCLV